MRTSWCPTADAQWTGGAEILRRLEHNGLVERHRYAEAPPRVEYSLTTAGKDLLVPIRALGDWAAVYADQIPAENKP
jgi:DNA-binding HxlR family transcriptional regulator